MTSPPGGATHDGQDHERRREHAAYLAQPHQLSPARRAQACRAIRRSLGKVSVLVQRRAAAPRRRRSPPGRGRPRWSGAPGGLEQVVVHELVHAAVVGGEPVVDGAQLGRAPGPRCRSPRPPRAAAVCSSVSPVLHVPLGQAPLDSARPGCAGRSRRVRALPVVHVDDDAARRGLLHRGQPPAACRRVAGGGGHTRRHCNQRPTPRPPSSLRAAIGAPRVTLPLAPCLHPPALPLLQERSRRLAPSLPLLTELGERFAAARARARARRRSGAGRVPRPQLARPRLHHRRPRPGADARACCAAGRTRSGTSAARSARSAPVAGEHTVEVTTYRADAYDRASRKPDVAVRRQPRGRPGAARLHRQRDGDAAARA